MARQKNVGGLPLACGVRFYQLPRESEAREGSKRSFAEDFRTKRCIKQLSRHATREKLFPLRTWRISANTRTSLAIGAKIFFRAPCAG